jgi:hypothetical protein
MLESIYQETVSLLEEEFYEKPFNFSYSSISKLLFSPAVFYQLYVIGNKNEEKELPHLVEGSLIHYLLLENNNFDEKYLVSPNKFPTGPSKLLVDKVFEKNFHSIQANPNLDFSDFKTDIIETLEEINYYQNIKLDSARISKVLTTETSNYWDFLKQKGSKILIDNETLKYCHNAVEVIRANPKIMQLLGQDGKGNIEVYNEEYLEAVLKGKPFGLKGIIDNIKIDHDKKTIYINDFKTSGKTLAEFKTTIEFYSYWLQAVIYMMIVSQKYFHLLEQDYNVKFHFIVIDKYFNTYAFPVSEKTRNEWLERFKETLKIIEYHYKNRRFDLPYEFDTESVIL